MNKLLNTEFKILFFGIVCIILAFIPFLFLGESSYIRIHDNLDSEFVYLEILKQNGELFSLNGSKLIPNIFNGLQRNYFHSEFSFIRLLFYIFPSFWAYVFNSILIRIIGFVGIILLSKDYFSLESRKTGIFLIALIFSFLPVYSIYGISVLGQPLLLWAFFNLREIKKITISIIIIIIFPFYSHIVLVAPFILIALIVYGIYYVIIKQKKYWSWYFLGIGILFFMYILSNVNMLYSLLFNEVESHRSGLISLPQDFYVSIKSAIKVFLFGHYHSARIVVYPTLILLIYSMFFKSKKRHLLVFLIFIIGCIAIFYELYFYIKFVLQDIIPILKSIYLNRFTFLIPFLYILLLIIINQEKKIKNYIFYILISVQLLLVLNSNKEIKYNYVHMLMPNYFSANKINTFESFFSKHLFKEISDYIDVPKENYRVVSLGIHPSISQYNGFYTLDSYQNNYPLSYKMEFREVIIDELNKNVKLKNYYDNWGHRCYLFSSELYESCYLNCSKSCDVAIEELSVNTKKLKQMGGKYIFSAVPIVNASQIRIELKKEFNNKHSNWRIFVYEIL